MMLLALLRERLLRERVLAFLTGYDAMLLREAAYGNATCTFRCYHATDQAARARALGGDGWYVTVTRPGAPSSVHGPVASRDAACDHCDALVDAHVISVSPARDRYDTPNWKEVLTKVWGACTVSTRLVAADGATRAVETVTVELRRAANSAARM